MKYIFAISFLICACCSAQTFSGIKLSGVSFPGVIFASPSYAPTNLEVLTMSNAMLVAGGTISSNDIWAIDQFYSASTNDTSLNYLTDVSIVAGDQSAAALIKLRSSPSAQRNSLLAIGNGAYVKAQGYWLTNGAALWPGIVTSNSMLSARSNGVHIWITGVNNYSRQWLWGTENTGSSEINYLWAGIYSANGDTESSANFGGTGTTLTGSLLTLNYDSMFGFSRTATNSVKLFVNGLESFSDTTSVTPQTDSNVPWALGARFTGNAPPSSANLDSLNGNYCLGFYALDNGMPYSIQTNFFNDVKLLMQRLGRLPSRSYPRNAIVISGQSNSYGEGNGAGDLTPSVFGNLVGGTSARFTDYSTVTNLPWIRTIAAEYQKSSGWKAGSDQLSSLSRTNGWGSTNDCLYMSFGKNGQNIGNYTRGSAPFQLSTNWAATQYQLETNIYGTGLSFKSVYIVGGESDGGNSSYGTSLSNLQTYYSNSLHTISGEAAPLNLFFSQHTAYAQGDCPENYAMLTNQETMPFNFLVMPKYQLSYVSDNIHIDTIGTSIMGEKYAEADYKVKTNGWWEPLRPVSLSVTGTTQCLIWFTNTVGGLTLHTNYQSWLTQSNCGFYYSDSGGKAITNVAIYGAASNGVLLTFNGNVSGNTARTVTYAVNATTNIIYTGGLSQGNGGILRNNNPLIGFTSKSNLWDWCVVFKKTF